MQRQTGSVWLTLGHRSIIVAIPRPGPKKLHTFPLHPPEMVGGQHQNWQKVAGSGTSPPRDRRTRGGLGRGRGPEWSREGRGSPWESTCPWGLTRPSNPNSQVLPCSQFSPEQRRSSSSLIRFRFVTVTLSLSFSFPSGLKTLGIAIQSHSLVISIPPNLSESGLCSGQMSWSDTQPPSCPVQVGSAPASLDSPTCYT